MAAAPKLHVIVARRSPGKRSAALTASGTSLNRRSSDAAAKALASVGSSPKMYRAALMQ